MLKIIKNKKISFIVADRVGIKKLSHGTTGKEINFEHLSCGHFIFPPLGTHSHASVDCPICGGEYTMNGFDGKHEHLNGTKGRVFCQGIEVIGHKY